MKRFLMLGLLFLGSFAAAQAQDVAKAKQILAKVSKKYKAYTSIQADFKQTVEIPAEKFKDEQKGTLYLKKDKFKLVMTDQTVMCDGKTMWTYVKDANEVTVNDYNPKTLGINPSEMFTMYEKGYDYAYMGEEKMGKKTVQVIELTPQDKKKSVFKVKLYIDKTDNTIQKSKAYEKNGNIYTYEIVSFTPNKAMADTDFSFDKSKYPGVSVVDVRRKTK